MRVAIAGGSGLIGSALRASLISDGHEVVRLVRRHPASPDEAHWDPDGGILDADDLAGVEAVVNLAGAGVGDRRWSSSYRRVLHDSRIRSTTLLASTMAQLPDPPRLFVSASGIAVYGTDRGDEILDEDSPAGDGFLALLCQEWEQAAAPARAAGIAVCHPRFGLVMGPGGGAFARMLPWFRAGLGGSYGNGDQWWSPVSLHDTVRALRFLIEEHGCVGAYDLTAPHSISNAEFARVLAAALNRPRLLHAPAFGLHLLLGPYARHILGSLNVVPARLTRSGFTFDHSDAHSIVTAALAGPTS